MNNKKQKTLRFARGPDGRFTDINNAQYFFKYGVNTLTHLIPLYHTNSGIRNQMGIKHITHAIGLEDADPYPFDHALEIEKKILENVGFTSPVDGKITNITDEYIEITDKENNKHKIYYPKNIVLDKASGSIITTKSINVKVGDNVKKGDVLINSNFNKGNKIAFGKILNVAYMPFNGLTNMDGAVISESASKMLASEHVLYYEIPKEACKSFKEKLKSSIKEIHKSYFYGKMPKEKYDKYNECGIPNIGEIINPGEYVYLHVEEREPSEEEKLLGYSDKFKPLVDLSLKNEELSPIKIIDVKETEDSYIIKGYTRKPLREGDKIGGLAGDKNVITKVLPDNEMPKTETGEPIHLIVSPLGLVSRMNIGQILEGAMIKNNIKNPEEVKDIRELFKKIKTQKLKYKNHEIEALVIPRYIVKQRHFVDKGLNVRSFDLEYSQSTGQPSKSGKNSSKTFDILTTYALLANGAEKFVSEAYSYLSDINNVPSLLRFLTNKTILPPQRTFIYEKVKSILNALGLDLNINNNNYVVLPFTDAHLENIGAVKIEHPEKLLDKNFEPIEGGLFVDGLKGKRFGYIQLPFRIPNPTFENAIATLLETTPRKLSRMNVDDIVSAIDNLDVDKELSVIDEKIKKEKDSRKKDILIRKKILLKTLKENNYNPRDIYLISKIPVIPSVYRPFVIRDVKGNKIIAMHGLNKSYFEIGLALKRLEKMFRKTAEENNSVLPQNELLSEMKNEIYKMVKDTYIKKEDSLLKELAGNKSPKQGFIQRALLYKRKQLSGMAVLSVDSSINIDEAKVPYDMLKELFKPFIIRRLSEMGYTYTKAMELIENNDPVVNDILMQEIKKRYVVINRHPSLHKYSVVALKPIPHNSHTIAIHPLVFKGLGADLDGDKVMIHVPFTEEANEEIKQKLNPALNIFKTGYNSLITEPQEDTLLGINTMLKPPRNNKIVREIKNMDELYDLLFNHTIHPNDLVKYKDKVTSAGRLFLADILETDVSNIEKIKSPSEYLNELKKLLKQKPDINKLNKLVNIADRVSTLSNVTVHPEIFIRHDLDKSIQEVEDEIKNNYKENTLEEIASKKIRGNPMYIRQMAHKVGKVLFEHELYDIDKGFPDNKSFTEAFLMAYQPRSNMVKEFVGMSIPGDLEKMGLLGMSDVYLTEQMREDEGLEIHPSEINDLEGRYLIKENGERVLIDEKLAKELIAKGNEDKNFKIRVSSPLTQKSYDHEISKHTLGKYDYTRDNIRTEGFPIGIELTHAIAEPLSQIVLKAKHITLGEDIPDVKALRSFLNVPQNSTYYAQIAKDDGKIEKITNINGANIITIKYKDGKTENVLAFRPLLVKEGDEVKKYQKLTEGFINPHLLPHDLAMKKFYEDLKQFYRKAEINVKDRILEMITKRIFNNAVVLEPGNTSYQHKEIIPLDLAKEIAKKDPSFKFEPVIIGLEKLPRTFSVVDAFLGKRFKEYLQREMVMFPRGKIRSYYVSTALKVQS